MKLYKDKKYIFDSVEYGSDEQSTLEGIVVDIDEDKEKINLLQIETY